MARGHALRWVAFAAVAAVAAAGCSRTHAAAPAATPTRTPTTAATTTVGPGPTPTESVVTGSVTPTPTATPLRVTEDQAASLLVSPGDLPPSYQVDAYVSPDTKVGLPPGCPLLDGLGAALTTAPVRAARGFAGGSVLPLLEERVAVLPGTAGDMAAQFARAATACHNFDSRDADGVTVRFAVTPLEVLDQEPVGQDLTGLALTGRPSASGPLVTQAAVLRRGDVLVLFVHSGLDKLDPTVLQAAAGHAAQALARM